MVAAGFLSLYDWSFTICVMPYNCLSLIFQIFHRLECSSFAELSDTKFNFFIKKVIIITTTTTIIAIVIIVIIITIINKQ